MWLRDGRRQNEKKGKLNADELLNTQSINKKAYTYTHTHIDTDIFQVLFVPFHVLVSGDKYIYIAVLSLTSLGSS